MIPQRNVARSSQVHARSAVADRSFHPGRLPTLWGAAATTPVTPYVAMARKRYRGTRFPTTSPAMTLELAIAATSIPVRRDDHRSPDVLLKTLTEASTASQAAAILAMHEKMPKPRTHRQVLIQAWSCPADMDGIRLDERIVERYIRFLLGMRLRDSRRFGDGACPSCAY